MVENRSIAFDRLYSRDSIFRLAKHSDVFSLAFSSKWSAEELSLIVTNVTLRFAIAFRCYSTTIRLYCHRLVPSATCETRRVFIAVERVRKERCSLNCATNKNSFDAGNGNYKLSRDRNSLLCLPDPDRYRSFAATLTTPLFILP